MTEAERDELVRDLARAGVRVLGVEPRLSYANEPDGWQIRCWCEQPVHAYTIGNAQRFLGAVRAGWRLTYHVTRCNAILAGGV